MFDCISNICGNIQSLLKPQLQDKNRTERSRGLTASGDRQKNLIVNKGGEFVEKTAVLCRLGFKEIIWSYQLS